MGKTNEAYVQSAIDKYSLLLSRYCKFDIQELPDVKNANKLPPDKLKEAEASVILNAIPAKACVLLLDENGRQYNSTAFAAFIDKRTTEFSKICFVIGGSYGLHEQVRAKGESIALSAMTFNHQMVRAILAEQLFRAFTIIKNTGYHH